MTCLSHVKLFPQAKHLSCSIILGIISNNITKIMTLTIQMWLQKTQELCSSIWWFSNSISFYRSFSIRNNTVAFFQFLFSEMLKYSHKQNILLCILYFGITWNFFNVLLNDLVELLIKTPYIFKPQWKPVKPLSKPLISC